MNEISQLNKNSSSDTNYTKSENKNLYSPNFSKHQPHQDLFSQSYPNKVNDLTNLTIPMHNMNSPNNNDNVNHSLISNTSYANNMIA